MSVATRYARTAGVLYLIVITCGIFSELAVRGRLIDFESAQPPRVTSPKTSGFSGLDSPPISWCS
jgi:hypothetical protein